MAAVWLRLLGQAVRSARRRVGLTQSQLGEPVVSKSFVSQLEKGAVAPSVASLFHMARQLAVSPVQLIALSDACLRADTLFTLAEAAVLLEGPAAAGAWTAALSSLATPDAPWVASRRDRLAGLRALALGQAGAAEEHLRQALHWHEAESPEHAHDDKLTTMYWLGAAQLAAGRADAAARMWESIAAQLRTPPVRRAVPEPVPSPVTSTTDCLYGATWLRLAELYERAADYNALARARQQLLGDSYLVTALQHGPSTARLLWNTAVEAYARADLPGARACARLIPFLLPPPDPVRRSRIGPGLVVP